MVMLVARIRLARAMGRDTSASSPTRCLESPRMSKGRACSGIAVAVSIVLGLSACGGAGESSDVVRVGRNAITKAAVDQWTNVVRRGGAFTGFRGAPRRGTPRQRALAL